MKLKVMVLLLAVISLGLPLWAAVPASSTGTRIQAPEQPAATKAPAGPKVITWTTITDITPAASRLAAAAVYGKVYRLAGESPSGRCHMVQEWDPATGLWTDMAPTPVACSNIGATSWRNQIYIVGGSDSLAATALDSLQVYNVDSNAWHKEAPMPTGLLYVGCAVVADTLYAIGGADLAGVAVNTCYAYDLVNKVWTTKTVMPTTRRSVACAVQNGKIYVFGGFGDLATVEAYDPATDSWATKSPMSVPRGGLAALSIGSRIYVMDGGWSSPLNTTAYYEPLADTALGAPWTDETSNTYARRSHGFASIGNTAYLIGGYSGGYLASVESGVTDAPVYNDAALYRIEIPQYLGNYGVSLTPYVTVSNLSPVRQYNIPVTMTVDSAGTQVYKGTGFVNLDSAAADYAILPQWSAGTTPGTVYTFKAWVNWPLDQNGANDTMTVTSEIMDAVWYQIDAASPSGSAAQNFEPANDAYDCWIMEDFWIAGPDSLWLDSVYVQGQYGIGPLDSIQLTIMPDSSGAPGYPAFSQPLWSGYFTPANYTDNAGSFMVRLPSQVKVYGNNPGLWMAFQGQMNYDVGGQWYINQNTMPLRGSYEGFWYNPNGGFGMGTGYVHQSSVWTGVYGHNFVLYGSLTPTGVAGQPLDQPLVHKFALAPAWPNPARGSARLNFSLDKSSQVSLSVYNLAGQKVATVASGSYPAGKHQVVWRGRDAKGNSVPGGVYLYRIQAGDRTATGKLVWLK